MVYSFLLEILCEFVREIFFASIGLQAANLAIHLILDHFLTLQKVSEHFIFALYRLDPCVVHEVVGEGEKVPTTTPRCIFRWSTYIRVNDIQNTFAHIPFVREWMSMLFAQLTHLAYCWKPWWAQFLIGTARSDHGTSYLWQTECTGVEPTDVLYIGVMI